MFSNQPRNRFLNDILGYKIKRTPVKLSLNIAQFTNKNINKRKANQFQQMSYLQSTNTL